MGDLCGHYMEGFVKIREFKGKKQVGRMVVGNIVENRETTLIKINIQIIFARKLEDLIPLLLNGITHGKGWNSLEMVIEYNMILLRDLVQANI